MNEVMEHSELKVFFDAIKELVELDEEMLDDEVMQLIQEQIKLTITPATIRESENQIIQNLEMQGTNRADMLAAMEAMKKLINELIYGEHIYTGNKKILVDEIVGVTMGIFDNVIAKYHNFL